MGINLWFKGLKQSHKHCIRPICCNWHIFPSVTVKFCRYLKNGFTNTVDKISRVFFTARVFAQIQFVKNVDSLKDRTITYSSHHNTTHNTQHTTHNTQHTTHNTQHTKHKTQNTKHNTQHTTHNTQHTTHNTQDINITVWTDLKTQTYDIRKKGETVCKSFRVLKKCYKTHIYMYIYMYMYIKV